MCSEKRIPVTIARQDSYLEKLDAEMDELKNEYKVKFKEIEQTAEKMNDEYQKRKLLVWERIENYLNEKNLLPSHYNPDKDNLSIRDGVIYILKGNIGEEHTREKALKALKMIMDT